MKDKDKEISSIIKAINLCHGASIVEEEFESNMPEEQAIFGFCKNMNFLSNPVVKNLIKKNYLRKIILKDIFGNETYYNVLGMNIEQKNGNEMKISIFTKKNDSNRINLYVRSSPINILSKFY